MAYKALYRKYRPTTFDEIAGQHHIVKTLENAVNQNKIAHAYLFCGPRGTGKTSTAKIFAKAVNCEGEVKPCDLCENCKLADEGVHPDIIEIDAASNNGVEEVRNLIEKVKYAPLKGRYKIYIIDEVHMMSKSAYNALLKTIEEPPAHVIFIFATTEPYKVLPTIISRCQRYDFGKIAQPDIVNYLSRICETESIKFEKGVLEAIAILADGGMRDALSILDQCYAYAPEQIRIKDVYDIYGVITIEERLELINNVNYKNTHAMIEKINQLDRRGVDVKRLTNDLIELLKEKVIYDYTNDADLLKTMSEAQVIELMKVNTAEESLRMIDILMDSYEKYRSATNLISYLEIALMKMMNVSRETLEPVKRVELVNQSPIKKPESNERVVVTPKVETKPVINEEPLIPENELTEQEVIVFDSQAEPIEEPILETETQPEGEASEDKVITQELPPETPVIKRVEKPATSTRKPLKDEYVLGLLVGATKEAKAIDKARFTTISNYEFDLDYAKQVSLLKPATIVASGNNYFIVAVDNQVIADEINDMDRNGELDAFIEVLMKRRKKIFALSNLQYDRVVADFRERYTNGMLPKPISVELPRENQAEDETIKSLNILFDGNFDVEED